MHYEFDWLNKEYIPNVHDGSNACDLQSMELILSVRNK